MKLSELEQDSKFFYGGKTYTKLNIVRTHQEYPNEIFDCIDSDFKHYVFREDVEVDPVVQTTNRRSW